MIDPGGAATVHQTVVPLNRKLTRFGAGRPAGADHFNLEGVQVNGEPAPAWSGVRDYFAPAQFEQMSDDQKLARPSFELMDAGAAVAADAVELGVVVGTEFDYESIIVDSPWERRPAPSYRLSLAHQMAFLELSPSARPGLRAGGLERFMPGPDRPPLVSMEDEAAAIVATSNLAARPDLGGPMTPGAAALALQDHLSQHPEHRGLLQVVSAFEVEATA
jgi:hypothetical protein